MDWILNTQGWLAVASAALFVTGAANALPDSESAPRSVENGGHETEGPEHTIIVGIGGAAEVEYGRRVPPSRPERIRRV